MQIGKFRDKYSKRFWKGNTIIIIMVALVLFSCWFVGGFIARTTVEPYLKAKTENLYKLTNERVYKVDEFKTVQGYEKELFAIKPEDMNFLSLCFSLTGIFSGMVVSFLWALYKKNDLNDIMHKMTPEERIIYEANREKPE